MMFYVSAIQADDINYLISDSLRGNSESQFLLAQYYSKNTELRSDLILSYALIQVCAPTVGAKAFKLQIQLSKLLTAQDKETAYQKASSIRDKKDIFTASLSEKPSPTIAASKPIQVPIKEKTLEGITRYIIDTSGNSDIPTISFEPNEFKIQNNILTHIWPHTSALKHNFKSQMSEVITFQEGLSTIGFTNKYIVLKEKGPKKETHLKFLSLDLKSNIHFINYQKALTPLTGHLITDDLIFIDSTDNTFYLFDSDNARNGTDLSQADIFQGNLNPLKEREAATGFDPIFKDGNLYIRDGYIGNTCLSILSEKVQTHYSAKKIGIPLSSHCSGMININNDLWISAFYRNSYQYQFYLVKYSINESSWEVISDGDDIPLMGAIVGHIDNYLISYSFDKLILINTIDLSSIIFKVSKIFKNNTLPFHPKNLGSNQQIYGLRYPQVEQDNIWTWHKHKGYLVYYKIPIASILKYDELHNYKTWYSDELKKYQQRKLKRK